MPTITHDAGVITDNVPIRNQLVRQILTHASALSGPQLIPQALSRGAWLRSSSPNAVTMLSIES